MSDPTILLDHDSLSELLSDPVMIRIVTVVNLASLSILELLEYGFSRKDVNRAMAKGIIAFDKPPLLTEVTGKDVVQRVPKTGDYYFGLLSSKIRLTKLGLYLPEITETGTSQTKASEDLPQEEAEKLYIQPTSSLEIIKLEDDNKPKMKEQVIVHYSGH